MVAGAALLLYVALSLLVGECFGALKLHWLPPPSRPASPNLSRYVPKTNVRGQVVTIVMSYYAGLKVVANHSTWLHYADVHGDVLDAFQKASGIVPRVVAASNCTLYENACRHIEDVIDGRAFAAIFVHPVHLRRLPVDYTPAWRLGHQVVVVGRGPPIGPMEAVARGVGWATLAAVAAAVAAAAVTWRLASPHPRPALTLAAAKVLALLVTAPPHNSRPITSSSVRLVVCACSVFGIIFGCLFQGVLVDNMTNIYYERQIQTFQELADLDFRINIPIQFYESSSVFRESDSPVMRRLSRRFRKHLDHFRTLEAVSLGREQAILTSNTLYDLFAPLLEKGPGSIYKLKETASLYFVAFPMAVGSPYAEWLRDIVGRALQGGLMDRWWQRFEKSYQENMAAQLNRKVLLHRYVQERDAEKKIISLRDLVAAFVLMIVGHSLAGGMLLVEIITARAGRCQEYFKILG